MKNLLEKILRKVFNTQYRILAFSDSRASGYIKYRVIGRNYPWGHWYKISGHDTYKESAARSLIPDADRKRNSAQVAFVSKEYADKFVTTI